MGGGGSPQVVQAEAPKQQKVVTPAVAKTIQTNTANAIAAQTQQQMNLNGVRKAYNRFQGDGSTATGNLTLGGR